MSTDTTQHREVVRSRLVKFGAPAVLLAAIFGLLAFCQTQSDPRTLRELIVQSRDAYHEPWGNVEEAASALGDAQSALRFVSERIAISFYEGRLQTPQAVLQTRTANPADKAMLLQALLDALDVPTQAIAAPLQGDARVQVLANAAALPIAMPEPMAALMERVGYDADSLGADQMGDAIETALLFDDVETSVGAALEHANTVLDLDGASSAQPVYLDWVWLEDADGNLYDPVLQDAERSDLARSYSDTVAPTQIALSTRDRFGRTREIVRWSGNAYGTDVSVAFYPTINTLERLIGDPDMSDVSVWTPGLIVGNELTTLSAVTNDGDVVPQSIVETLSTDDSDSVDVSGFLAPQISSLSIASIDATTFPRVQVGLSAAVQNMPNWHGAHFTLMVDGQRLPVRIEEPFSTATDVIVVHDQSGSMRQDDRFAMARTFNQSMVGGLSAPQKLAVIAHNDAIRVQRLFDPLLNVGQANQDELWQLPVRGTTSFLDALDYALNAVEIELGQTPETRTSIVLVSDGASSQADLEALQTQMSEQAARAQALNTAIYPVILSAASTVEFAALADDTGGQLIRLQDPAQIPSAAAALARRLSGGMAVSFIAPHDPVPAAGSSFAFSLEVDGYEGLERTIYTVPEDIVSSQPAVFIEISAGAHRSVRPVVALGDAYDVNAMTGQHTLYLTPGTYPSDRMSAQRLNQWLMAHDAVAEDEEALHGHLQDPGLSTQHARTMNGLASLMRASVDEGQALQFPIAAMVHSVALDIEGEDNGMAGDAYQLATTIDVPAWSTFLSEPASRQEVARMGLALNDAEARLLGNGLNLTQLFAENAPVLTTSGAEDEGVMLARADTAEHVWWHDRSTGSLFGYLQTGVLAAKGSRDVALAAYFNNISSAIDQYMSVAQPGVGVLPTKAVLSGFIGFKKEELKLWCYSTIMLNYVGESIADEEGAILDQSVAAAEARAAQLCEIEGDPRDVGERMFRAALTEMAKAIAEEVRGQLPGDLNNALSPPDLAARLADRLGVGAVTDWIADPTTRQYAEQVRDGARDYLSARTQEYAGRGYDAVSSALQRHGLGGGTGASGGTPTTTGFDVAMQRAIAGL